MMKLLQEIATPVPTYFFLSSRRRHTSFDCDWSSDVCSSDLEPPTTHAVAHLVSSGDGAADPARLEAKSPLRVIEAAELYGTAARLGLNYGPRFRTVTRVEVLGPDEALAHLDPTVIGEAADLYLLHPALLDGALQAFLALLAG